MAADRRRPLDLVPPWLVAATVVAFACGSSSIGSVTRVGHDARWVVLALLLAAAAARALATKRYPPAPPVMAAGLFVALALVSAAWSLSPRLSFERGVSVGLLFAAALLLAGAELEPGRILAGLVGGAAVIGVIGLLLLAADHSAAVQAASIESPARYRGLGQDANTAALLFALVLPIALVLAMRSATPRARLAFAGAAALFAGSIVASGSRGALFAGGAGAFVSLTAAARSLRPALVAGAAVVAAVGIGLAVQNIPKAATTGHAAVAPQAESGPPAKRGYLNADFYPLDADVGGPLPGGGQPSITRGVLGGSGRLDAWIGTLHQILERPLLGFGFGTEAKVFVDRYYYFVGGSPENAYLGVSLQLGLVGLAVLLALFATVAWPVRRARRNAIAAACAGAVAAGVVLAVVQSYVYSVGDIGTATFWISAFLLPVVARVR